MHIVLIEDDEDLRKVTKLTLEYTAGWRVSTAPDGEQGLVRVKQAEPDAVVVDIMMPGMDGFEVCRRLREDADTAGIPVVLLTARKELDQGKLREVEVAGVLYKPFEPGELAGRIRELLGR